MEELKKKSFSTAKELAKCAVMVVLMVVAAFVKIPLPFMPVSFQTVIGVLAGLLLGWKYGALAMLCYLIMGTIGIPVFTEGGGFWYVTKLTYGYIIGFVCSAAAGGAIAWRSRTVTFRRMLIASLAATLADYIAGIPYFALIWTYYLDNGGLAKALWTYNIIYLFKDIVLAVLAAFLAYQLLPVLNKTFTKKILPQNEE